VVSLHASETSPGHLAACLHETSGRGEGDWRRTLHSSECLMERCWRLWWMVREWSICLAHCMRRGCIIQTWYAVLGRGSWAGAGVGRARRGKSPEGWPINALVGRLHYRPRGAGRFGGAFDAVSLAGITVNLQ